MGSKVTGDEEGVFVGSDVTGDLVGMDVSSIVIGDLLGKLVGLEDGLKKAYKRHVYVRRVNFEMTEILLKTHVLTSSVGALLGFSEGDFVGLDVVG